MKDNGEFVDVFFFLRPLDAYIFQITNLMTDFETATLKNNEFSFFGICLLVLTNSSELQSSTIITSLTCFYSKFIPRIIKVESNHNVHYYIYRALLQLILFIKRITKNLKYYKCDENLGGVLSIPPCT